MHLFLSAIQREVLAKILGFPSGTQHRGRFSVMHSWHRATQLSYSPIQTGGGKIVDDDYIFIYTLEELERLESL
jgi:hypothetical protein